MESIKNCYLFLEKLQISGIFNEEKEMMDLIICDQNLEGNWRIWSTKSKKRSSHCGAAEMTPTSIHGKKNEKEKKNKVAIIAKESWAVDVQVIETMLL